MKKRIYYVGNFILPDGNAAGKRVYANALLFTKIGYKVVTFGFRGNDINYDNKEFSQDSIEFNFFERIGNEIPFLGHKKYFKQFIGYLEKNKSKNIKDMVIYYGSPSNSLFLHKIIVYCKKHKIKIISDCVDWLKAKTNNFIFNFFRNIDTYYQKAVLNKKVDGLIVVSDYLKKYYFKKNMNILLIPPLSYKNKVDKIPNFGKTIKFIYAGQPFRLKRKNVSPKKFKDRLDIVIDALEKAKQKEIEFIFNIYGITEKQYLFAIPQHKSKIDYLSNSIIFHGYKDNKEVLETMQKSSFMILMRDSNKSNNFGFPSKVSESISCGTPVIVTNTSDLSNYIVNGINGYIIENNSESLLEIIMKTSKFSSNKIYEMKLNCVESGIFKIDNYETKLRDFLEKI